MRKIIEKFIDLTAIVETDENGLALFSELELGTYYIREAKQVNGYVINETIYKVEVTADGDSLEITCVNTPTEMFFSKQDITNSKELPGAHIVIKDKETGEDIVKMYIDNDTGTECTKEGIIKNTKAVFVCNIILTESFSSLPTYTLPYTDPR